jgi:O-antigen/teichoic acid export membrane protein
LVYASGSYGKVLGIGLATNMPRVVLYFLLVPIYSGLGAALSFLTGALTGLIAAIIVSGKVHFKVSLRKITVAIVAPSTITLVSLLMGFSWLIGGSLILLVSILFYGRLGVVERDDLAEVARAFASEKTIAKASERLNRLLKIIYGE